MRLDTSRDPDGMRETLYTAKQSLPIVQMTLVEALGTDMQGGKERLVGPDGNVIGLKKVDLGTVEVTGISLEGFRERMQAANPEVTALLVADRSIDILQLLGRMNREGASSHEKLDALNSKITPDIMEALRGVGCQEQDPNLPTAPACAAVVCTDGSPNRQ